MRRAAALAAGVLGLGGFAAPALAAMTLTSADIAPGATIAPAQVYPRCGGRNVSPELSWTGIPPQARSLVLTMIDVDVKPSLWAHWIVTDLPPSVTHLPRGIAGLPGKARVLPSDFGDAAYGGPCPPEGSGTHHYQFTIWAMPTPTTRFPEGATAADIARTLSRQALASATFTGVARR